MTHRFVVFADDSTGANASAGALSDGFHVPVPVLTQLPPSPANILVLNTRSRESRANGAQIVEWTHALWQKGYRDFDKRIDTTLRGPGPEDLQRLCTSLPQKPWIGVVAAYPKAHRTTRLGRQFVEGQPAASVVSLDSDHLSTYLFGREDRARCVTTEQLAHQGLAKSLAASSQPVIFDAESDAHLAIISLILREIRQLREGPLVTVTSGDLLRYYPAPTPVHTAIIMGSPTDTNVRQASYLASHTPAMLWPLSQPIGPIGDTANIIVFHSGLATVRENQRIDMSTQLAIAARLRLTELASHGWQPDRLIVTGGEMSQSFLDETHARGLDSTALASPLVGHGWIRDGLYKNTEIMTKGGMVGHDALLVELCALPALRPHNHPQGSNSLEEALK